MTKALPGYYVFFDETALHVTWDEEGPLRRNFGKGNHDSCGKWETPGKCGGEGPTRDLFFVERIFPTKKVTESIHHMF